jgi:gliding motility-associated-like protein
MRKSILALGLFILSLTAIGQNTNISGVINKYSKVTEVIRCGNRMIVDSPGLFAVNMQVLIIQMKGANMDQSNTVAYGNVVSYASAGNYEIQTIDSILGDTIKFKFQLERLYDASGCVQMMPLPVYNTATVTGKLACKQWNGAIGGVLLLKADSLVLNDSIKISGLGFRGFYNNDSSQLCFGGQNGGFYFSDSMQGAPKGEGAVVAPYIYGRGKNINGGGGGNNENTGGGGGGNFGHGGLGGAIVPRTAFCPGNDPGAGGVALPYNDTLNKIFLGGGGGCGHGNNSEGTGGTNGGAICIIIANTLVGNNKGIVSDGKDQTLIAGSDGAGGGGAGGTILLSVGQYVGNVGVRAKGGNGGKLNNDFLARSCMGPAGGGGGGALWVNQPAVPANINFTAPPGISGFNLSTGQAFCPYGLTNGAAAGDTGGSVKNLAIPISVTPYIRLSATASNDSILCNDQPIVLTGYGLSSDSIYYNWSTGLPTQSISFLATQTATYTVSVSDRNTCTITKSIDLTVEHVLPNFSPDTAMCSPANITLHADNPGTTPVTYLWNTTSTSPSISFLADSTRSYTVTVTSAHNCSATATINVSVGNLSATYSPDTTICSGASVVIGAFPTAGGSYSYAWNSGQTTSTITVSPLVDSTYTVSVSAGAGCTARHDIHVSVETVAPAFSHDTAVCNSGNVILHADNTASTPVTYDWNTGAHTASISVNTTTPQTYTVTVTSAHGCSATASMYVNVGNLNVTYSDDTAVCPGNDVTLLTNLKSGNNVKYTWSNGDSTSSITITATQDVTYDVTVHDDAGCVSQHSFVIRMDFLGTIISGDTTICPAGTANLIVDVPNVSNVTYLWSNNETTQQITVTNTSAQTYTVTVSGPNGCTGTATVNVLIDSVHITTIDTTICPNSSATIYASATGIGASTFLWSTGQTSSAISVTPAASQGYHVTATDSLGCQADTSAFVTADNNATHLTLQITSLPDSSYGPGDSVQLSVTGNTLAHFVWTPDSNLTSGSIQSPIATPQRATQYCVAVIDSSNCAAQICREILVGTPPATVALANAFTPNGDGKNDTYKAVAIDGTNVASLKIYNRWGELVYDGDNSTGWNGMVNNVPQPSEVYTCFVTYYQKIYPEKTFQKMGKLTLIR